MSPKANAITPPKWDSYRDLAVSSHVLALLLDHLDEHVQPGPDAPLFRGRGIGGRVSQSQLDRVWRAAREQVKPGFRFHDLRHSGLTHYAHQSATLAELLHPWWTHRRVRGVEVSDRDGRAGSLADRADGRRAQ